MFRENNITRELIVRLHRNPTVDVLSHLENQPTNTTQAVSRRRVSIASSNVFLIGNNIREAGFDFYQRTPRLNRVNVGASTSHALERTSTDNFSPLDLPIAMVAAPEASSTDSLQIDDQFFETHTPNSTNAMVAATNEQADADTQYQLLDEENFDLVPLTIEPIETNESVQVQNERNVIAIVDQQQDEATQYEWFNEDLDLDQLFKELNQGDAIGGANLAIEEAVAMVNDAQPVPSDEDHIEWLNEEFIQQLFEEPNQQNQGNAIGEDKPTVEEDNAIVAAANEQSDDDTQYLLSDEENFDLIQSFIEPIKTNESVQKQNERDVIAIVDPQQDEAAQNEWLNEDLDLDQQFKEVNQGDSIGGANPAIKEANVMLNDAQPVPSDDQNQGDAIGESNPTVKEGISMVNDTPPVPPAINSQNNSQAPQQVIYNDFQPFHRLPNLPFTISGRPRAISLDTHFNRFIPSVEPTASTAPVVREPNAREPTPRRERRLSCIAVPTLDTIVEEDAEDILADIKKLFL